MHFSAKACSFLLILCVFQGSAQSPDVFYVNSSSASPSPDGSPLNPYSDLTTALLSSPPVAISLHLEPFSADPYPLATLGMHALVSINCHGSAVIGIYTILVGPGVLAEFRGCKLSSAVTEGVMMAVLGSVLAADSSISGLVVKGFGLYGTLTILDSSATGNSDSLIAAPLYGFALSIQRSSFQFNVAQAGTIMAFSLSGSGASSATSISVDSCVFIGNGAYMGGSILLLYINSYLLLPNEQLSDARTLIFTNNTFYSTPGYAFLLYSKYFSLQFTANNFTNVDYPFVSKLYDSQIAVRDSLAISVNRYFTCTFNVGLITFERISIIKVYEGPAIFIPNSAPVAGQILLKDIYFREINLTNPAYYSASVLCVNSVVSVINLHAEEGFSYTCGGGCFIFSQVYIDNISVNNLTTVNSGLVGMLFSVCTASNLAVKDTMVLGSTVNSFLQSSCTVRTAKMDISLAAFLSTGRSRPNYSFFALFNSRITVQDVYILIPPIDTTAAFYLWNSVATISDVYIPLLYSNLVNLYSTGSVHIWNVTVGRGLFDQLVTISFFCEAKVRDFELGNFRSRVSPFSVLSKSVLLAENVHFRNVILPGLITASDSTVKFINFTLEEVQIDTLFQHIRQW